MADMSLNIDYNVKRLVMIAIVMYKTKKEQAEALGIHTRTLNDYLKRFNLCEVKKQNN